MRIILLGGSGFIGSNLIKYLLERNYSNIVVYDIVPPRFKQVEYIKGSIEDITTLSNIIQEKDCVICLSNSGFPNQKKKDLYSDVERNVLPILKVAQMCMEKSVERFIFSSSGGSIYGIPQIIPINEKHETNPISTYGICKLVIEKYLEMYARLFDSKIIILRIANPYGKYQKPFSGQGVIATFLANNFLNNEVEVWGDGNAYRDYIWIEDVTDAIEKAVTYCGKEQIFNIGSGKGHNVNEVIQITQNVTGKQMKVIYQPSTAAEIGKNVLDCTLAKQELNWIPKVELYEGICKMCRMWNTKERAFTNEG